MNLNKRLALAALVSAAWIGSAVADDKPNGVTFVQPAPATIYVTPGSTIYYVDDSAGVISLQSPRTETIYLAQAPLGVVDDSAPMWRSSYEPRTRSWLFFNGHYNRFGMYDYTPETPADLVTAPGYMGPKNVKH